MASAVRPSDTLPHTSTQQWQSFEMRMRQRRIDRLLLRAQIAHEAGCDEEAREALAEAEQLNGYASRLEELPPLPSELIIESDIAGGAESNPTEAEPTASRTWIPRVAAAMIVVGALGWFAVPHISDLPVMNAVVQTAAQPLADATLTEPVATGELPGVRMSVVDLPASNAVPESIGEARESQPISLVGREAPAALSTSYASSPVDLAALPAIAPIEPSPEPSVPPAVPVSSSTPLADAPTAPVPGPPPVPEVTSSAVRPTVSNDEAIRAALARYESAYSRLDADAARAVWPGLDGKALARAFDGLASQQVNLGSCDVRVFGEVAIADCAGSTTWTPKVGGGSRSQPRRWQFRLRNAAAGWQIVGAIVR